MNRRITLEVDGIRAVARLEDELSPRAAQAFWDALPMERTLMHAKWSGETCFFRPGPDLAGIVDLENPVTAIYPGTLVMRPRGTEALIAYGVGEYRWGIGTDYTARLATIVENEEDFLRTISRVHDDGEKQIRVDRLSD